VRLTYKMHSLLTALTYISSYRENLDNRASPINGFKIGDYTSVDLLYSLDITPAKAKLTAGFLNILGQEPPTTTAPGDLQGFDRLQHDPRGTMFYIRAEKRF